MDDALLSRLCSDAVPLCAVPGLSYKGEKDPTRLSSILIRARGISQSAKCILECSTIREALVICDSDLALSVECSSHSHMHNALE